MDGTSLASGLLLSSGMRMACAVVLAAVSACTEHADGETCVWVPGSDGTCGGDDGGGSAPVDHDYVRYPEAAAVAIGDRTHLFVIETDERYGDSIQIGAMRPGGLPAVLEPWAFAPDRPRRIAAWSALDRGLVVVEDASGTRAIEVDGAGQPTSATAIAIAAIVDAAFDGNRWLLVTHTPTELGVGGLTGGPQVIATLEAGHDTIADLEIVSGANDEALVVWRQHRDGGAATVRAARVVAGALTPTVTLATDPDAGSVTRLLAVPGTPYRLWLQSSTRSWLATLDPVTLEGTSEPTPVAKPHALVTLREGYLGATGYDLVHYDAALTMMRPLARLPAGELDVMVPNGADFVALAHETAGIRAVFSYGEEVDSVMLVEGFEYPADGCAAAGSSGGGLALLASLGLVLRRRRRWSGVGIAS